MNGNIGKIISLVVLAAAIIFVVKYFKSNQAAAPKEPDKGISEVMAEDDKRLRPTEEELGGPVETTDPGISERTRDQDSKYRVLAAEERVAAERTFEMALAQRKIARMPGMTYKLMVDYCRDMIQKYPGTIFEEKARQMLSEIPVDKRALYNITEQEINPQPKQ